jgi:hypothetical protein
MIALLRGPSPTSRAASGIALAALLITLTAAAPTARAQQGGAPIVIDSVDLTDFEIVDNVLTAAGTVTGTIAGLPFTTDITNFVLQLVPDDPATPGVECSVLDLELGPINLALLGLHVDTSAICLAITATEGGGLLGDLLCGLAGGGLLGTGIPILPGADAVGALEGGLADILDGTLGQDFAAAEHTENSVCTGECEILELVLGPLDLSLLGLNVFLDDCEGGPVQVCVSASRGEGILGNLLCGLTNAQLINLTLADITQLATRAVDLVADGVLSRRDVGTLTALLGRLIR